ncbi:MAG: ABC transporter permease [Spirochaetes bacterium]|nr:ABC transporter permease [Spirochaetota bacterium]
MIKNFIVQMGRSFLNKLDYFGGISSLFVYSIIETIRGDKYGNKLVKDIIKKQIFFTGYNALTIISVISLSLGVVIIVQATTVLSQLGAEEMIGKILNIVILRELGPILTAIIIIGRSGTAIATEIGNMKVSHEIEAIESMGIDPLKFIVFPRIIGGMIAMTCLTIYFSAIGIFGGILVGGFIMHVPLSKFFQIIISNMAITDLMISFLKSIVFGAIIATIGVYHGFKIMMSPTEVPQAVTKSVVNALIYTFIFNGIVTMLFYL